MHLLKQSIIEGRKELKTWRFTQEIFKKEAKALEKSTYELGASPPGSPEVDSGERSWAAHTQTSARLCAQLCTPQGNPRHRTSARCLPGSQAARSRGNAIYFKRKHCDKDLGMCSLCLNSQSKKKSFSWISIFLGSSKCIFWGFSLTCGDKNQRDTQQNKGKDQAEDRAWATVRSQPGSKSFLMPYSFVSVKIFGLTSNIL